MKEYSWKELLPLGHEKSGKKQPKSWVIWLVLGAIFFLACSSFWEEKGNKKEEAVQEASSGQESEQAYIRAMEERLTDALSGISGAGKVSVFLHIEQGNEHIFAADTNRLETDTGEDGETRYELEKKVVLGGQSGRQQPFVTQEKLPVPSGVLVVAEGAKNEAVKFEIYEAVKALFGLSPHRIKITY